MRFFLWYLAATYLLSQPFIYWGLRTNTKSFLVALAWAPLFWPTYFAAWVQVVVKYPLRERD